MEFKHIELDLKASGDGLIEGYGAVYGVVDTGGDIIAPGAFRDSLASGRKVRMLKQHDPSQVIGVWTDITEDRSGLRVKGQLLMRTEAGRDTFEELSAKAIDGLSIGYRTLEVTRSEEARIIEKADLWEVSVVTFPMNTLAKIDAVKAADLSKRDLERMLTQDAQMTRSVARALMAGGYDAVKAMHDAGDDAEELAALLRDRLIL